MSNKEDGGGEAYEPSGKSKFSGVRRMVEDIVVTPFFQKHSSHMPATIKLHADVVEKGEWVILKTEIPDFDEDLIDVSANENSIHVRIHSGEKAEAKTAYKTHESDIMLHSAYVTPVPIDPSKLKVSHKGGILEVKVPKK
jgi:HSP20 family molecular chaperone IbpA